MLLENGDKSIRFSKLSHRLLYRIISCAQMTSIHPNVVGNVAKVVRVQLTKSKMQKIQLNNFDTRKHSVIENCFLIHIWRDEIDITFSIEAPRRTYVLNQRRVITLLLSSCCKIYL